ncbi:MAG: purine-nucleoside phosphorylase [Chloroflexi bacterium]|nr:purine-nucleoside phosphorylase [Chloroflexota bacterium]
MTKHTNEVPGSEWRVRRQEAAAFIRSKTGVQPQVGLILGSGLGALASEIAQATVIPYAEIPHFPVSTVHGHAGELVIGELEGKRVIAMNGRFHFYEGYSLQQVVFPVWVMRTLGASVLIATNAAGGINRSFTPGDLMVIVDHINLLWDNPLIGPNDDELGVRFPSMKLAYPWELVEVAQRAAEAEGIALKRGVYIATQGPNYASQAESEFFRLLRGDAVGMSTVPEIIAATHAGMKTLGISCITDAARDPKAGPSTITTHEEVIRVANETKPKFTRLMKACVRLLEV